MKYKGELKLIKGKMKLTSKTNIDYYLNINLITIKYNKYILIELLDIKTRFILINDKKKKNFII